MTPFAVRPATDHDAESMAAIAASNPTAPQWTAEQFREMLQPSAEDGTLRRATLVVEHASQVAGFAVVSALCAVFPPEAELESIAVTPTLQGRGIGLGLLRAALGWAAAQHAETLRLEVRAGNDRARQVYAHSGFRQTGRRPGYYSAPMEDAVVMERTLTPSADDPPMSPLA